MSWKLREVELSAPGPSTAELREHFGIPEWTARILRQRMQSWSNPTLEAAARFLEPSLKYLPDPFQLPDMDRAAERLSEAIVNKETIAVYGDYDVDGTVGSAVMRRFLRALGCEPIIYQPDRQKEGYGINAAAIETLAQQGASLLIAVDCGITSVKEVERANELGVDVIICDHHEPKEVLPPAYAVLDHKREDNESPIRSLSGAGVAFYLAIATRSMLRDIEFFEGGKEPDVRELLDLVALAAVADLVPLVEENRILVKVGLDKMRKSPIAGIRALLEVADVKPEDVNTFHLGFILGPRINASGRLGSANAALELLSTDDMSVARSLASQLDGINQERMDLQSEIAQSAIAQAEQLLVARGSDWPALVVYAPDWHEGVIGIVASRLTEKFSRPAAVITFATHTGLGKGSVRSFGKLDMTKALEDCSNLLAGFGGHKAAAGLSLPQEQVPAFQEAFAAAVGAQAQELVGASLLPRETFVDAQLANEDVSRESVEFLEKLAPFGMSNPEPVVILSGWKVTGTKTLKERHLKIQFTSAQNRSLEGFWANGVEKWRESEVDFCEIAGTPVINTFRNQNKVEIRIKDIRAHSNEIS